MTSIFVEVQSWPGKRGIPRATLVAALTDLEELLQLAQAAGEVSDYQAVLARISVAARAHEASEPEALEELEAMVGEGEVPEAKCSYCGHGHGEHGACLECNCPGWCE